MKKIGIFWIAALIVVVSASGTWAVICNCAGGTCTVSTDPLIIEPISACPSCNCGGTSGSSSAATQPVTTKFLKDNYQGLPTITDGEIFDRLRNSGYSPITQQGGTGYDTDKKKEALSDVIKPIELTPGQAEQKGRKVREARERAEDLQMVVGLHNILKKSNATCAAVERNKAKGMDENHAINLAIDDFRSDLEKYEAEGMSPADAAEKAWANLGLTPGTESYEYESEKPR